MKKTNEKVAIIYCRVSSSKQDYTRQIDELTAIAKRDGYLEIEVFAESISSYRKKSERVELSKMLAKVEADPSRYGCIYVSEVSRIGRNPTDTRRTIDTLTDLGLPVYIQSINRSTIDKDGKRDGIMNMILQVLIEYADSEAETFKMRSRSGLLKSARDGKAGGSTNLPYGYAKDGNKMLIVDEEEAKVIEEIFQLYISGNGIKVISNILNDRMIPTRTNKTHAGRTLNYKLAKDGSEVRWSDKQIHDILRNTLYYGARKFKGEILPAPAIVNKEIFDECASIMQFKTHRNYLTTYTYLLKDLIVCGCCGRNYFARYKPVDGGDKVYICSSRMTKEGNCGNIGVNISLLESAIFDQLIGTGAMLKYLNNTNEIRASFEADLVKLKQDLKISEGLLKEKHEERERLLDLYLKGGRILKTNFISRQDKIDSDLVSITEKIDLLNRELKGKGKALKNLDNMKATKQMLFNARDNRNELQGIYKQFIHKVIVNKLDNNKALVNVYISLSGDILKQTLKLVLDLSGMRKKPMVYKYYSFSKIGNELIYVNNKLVGIDDVRDEVGSYLTDAEIYRSGNDWKEIEDKHLLIINQ